MRRTHHPGRICRDGKSGGADEGRGHNVDEFAKLDLSFHLAMAMAAKNEVLNNLSSMREQTMELITKSLLSEEGMENALRGHTKILESFRQRIR